MTTRWKRSFWNWRIRGKRYDPCIAQKQLLELGAAFVRSSKTGKRRSRAGAFGYALLFAVLMLLVMLSFGSMALPLAVTLVPQGLDWLYFVLMELSALTVSVLASAFTSYGHLFRCRDNQQLLALPIPPGAIFAVRCGGVYLTGLIYLLLAWVPSVVCYALAAPRPGGALLAALPVALALAGISMVLAVLLGWAVALLNRRAQHKSLVTVVGTLLFLAVSTILNIFLDLALVLAVPLGVLGVALGTVIAQLCSWLFGIWYINRRYPQLAIHPFNGIFDRKLFCEIIRIGLPSGIQMSLVALGAMGVLSKVNSYGKAFTAGFNVGNKLDTLSFLPVQSLAAAVISFVGQNMGASREDRVRQGVRITVTMAVVWTVLSSALVVWLSVPLSRIFSPDPAVIAASVRYLQCVMPPYVLFAILFVLNSAMRGAGDSLYPMVNVVASVILLRVPFLYLLANRFGPDAMYWSYGIGWAVACALSVYHYAAGKWRGKYHSE